MIDDVLAIFFAVSDFWVDYGGDLDGAAAKVNVAEIIIFGNI